MDDNPLRPGTLDLTTQAGAGLSDLVSDAKSRNQILAGIYNTLLNILPRIAGTFTLAASASTTIPQTGVTANSQITWTPLNAAAGTVEGSAKKLYISARSPGVSFTVTTADGVAAGGTEQFQYSLWNPL